MGGRGCVFGGAGTSSGVPSALGGHRPGEDGVKRFPPRWDKCRQQKAGGEKAAEGRRGERPGANAPSRAGPGPAQGRGWHCLRRGQMAGRPCQTARGRIRRSAPRSESCWPPPARAGVGGATGVRRGDCASRTALQWPFVRPSWPGAGGSAGPTPTLAAAVPGRRLCSPVPRTPGVPSSPCPQTGPSSRPAVPQPSCPASPCPVGLGSRDLGCQDQLLPHASRLQYGGREWNCWDRLEMRAVGADGQEMTVQDVLDWLQVSLVRAAPSRVPLGGAGLDPDTQLLQRTHGWTVTMLLRGHTLLYDREEDEETRAQQRVQR